MNCKSCNNVLPDNAKFCNKCGSEVTVSSSENNDATIAMPIDSTTVESTGAIIKCGNCGYIGAGEKNRSLGAQIIAWICVLFVPLITILYFVATHKYRCPKCKSTFLGIKNKEGVFTGQMGGTTRWILIVIIVFFGIAVIGILSSVIFVSLNTARQKSADASVKANFASLRLQGALYEDANANKSYMGFCNDSKATGFLKLASKSASLNQSESNYVCNDSSFGWAASVPLRGGGYWCADSSENDSRKIDTEITTQISCLGGSGTNMTSNNVNWSTYIASKEGFSILLPKTPTLDSESDIVDDADPTATYSWHSYKSNDDISAFFVYKYAYSGSSLDVEDPDKVLKAYLNSWVNPKEGNQILSSSLTYVNTYRALDFLIKAGAENNIKGRFILVGKTLYLIMMDYFPVNYDTDTYNKFINSFKVI